MVLDASTVYQLPSFRPAYPSHVLASGCTILVPLLARVQFIRKSEGMPLFMTSKLRCPGPSCGPVYVLTHGLYNGQPYSVDTRWSFLADRIDTVWQMHLLAGSPKALDPEHTVGLGPATRVEYGTGSSSQGRMRRIQLCLPAPPSTLHRRGSGVRRPVCMLGSLQVPLVTFIFGSFHLVWPSVASYLYSWH